jgi:hypothetical protein
MRVGLLSDSTVMINGPVNVPEDCPDRCVKVTSVEQQLIFQRDAA